MAPVDKSTDGSDSADKSGTSPPSPAIGENKTVGGTSAQGLDQSAKQGTPVLDGTGYAETTMSSKLENADILSEYMTQYLHIEHVLNATSYIKPCSHVCSKIIMIISSKVSAAIFHLA